MPIHSDKNLYPGVNAHLNSYLQNETGKWAGFHNEHVTDIARHLKEVLPSGYFAVSETSLQILGYDPEIDIEKKSYSRPDATVYQINPMPLVRSSTPTFAEATQPVLSLRILETLIDPEPMTGLVIYQAGEGGILGRPITRIELLSPSNMPSGSHNEQYLLKRMETLKSGLRLVEIDYLHQLPPIVKGIASYPKREIKSFPYLFLVTDPRPTLEQGRTDVYGIEIMERLPVINIPLAGADFAEFDFGKVYDTTYESSSFFRLVVDYAQDPPAFDKYTPEDQERIKELLEHIRKNASQGENEIGS